MASKKTINGWAMYDWANSAYNLVITSTIFPAYYDAITTTRDASGKIISHEVLFWGRSFQSASLYNYAIAAAYLIIAILSPVLSSVADYKRNKKRFMQFFCYLGSAACCMLYFFTADALTLGIVCAILAAIGYCGSLVFYNAYLPEIAPPAERDAVSAKGFAYGYVGSVILQLICFVFVLQPQWFGIKDPGFAPRLSFLLVGLWWMGFAQIPFSRLKDEQLPSAAVKTNVLTNGFKELAKVFSQVRKMKVLKRFLAAFFFYSMGVQTVMLAATLFGSQVLQLSTANLIACILIIQLVAIAGAYMIAALSARLGNLPALSIVVAVWIGICIGAYFIDTAMQFYIIAALVGIVMGGIQSLSRSTYSKIMPVTTDTTSFFSFFDVAEKLAIVIGMLSFGLIQELTGNMRNSIIGLIVFFIIGLAFLFSARIPQKGKINYS